MADSGTGITDSVALVKVTEVEIKNRDGSTRKMIKNEQGRFVKKPKPVPPAREFTRLSRNFLMKLEADETGKINKKSKTKYIKLLEDLALIVELGSTDPKYASAAAKCAEVILKFAIPPQKFTEEELEAVAHGGVKVVFNMNDLYPAGLPTFEGELKPREEVKKPTFVDAVVVEQNPAPK